jgi:hypothetical protein
MACHIWSGHFATLHVDDSAQLTADSFLLISRELQVSFQKIQDALDAIVAEKWEQFCTTQVKRPRYLYSSYHISCSILNGSR